MSILFNLLAILGTYPNKYIGFKIHQFSLHILVSILTFTRGYNFLFFIQVVFMALDMASTAFQCGGRLENMPQRLRTSLTICGEVVKCWDELVSFVAEEIGLLSLLHWFQFLVFPAFPFIGIEYLQKRKWHLHQPENLASKLVFTFCYITW